MIVAGNKKYGVAEGLTKVYPDAIYCSRNTGYDFEKDDSVQRFAEESTNHNEIILVSALWKFQQTLLLQNVFQTNMNAGKTPLIVVLGSTVDRYYKASSWIYGSEKKALREYADACGKLGIHMKAPRVTLISLCTLTNKQDQHEGRVCMEIDRAVSYIKWIIDQPRDVCINEISIDMIQSEQ